ncbi:hypothetical protein PX699_13490 [Sphingobium sp. H39-3-25]|uniref:hypothetical protein n=1 Tax=Sphingobium arseniciresistens TaxID=3030834 RepID=UPI0023B93B5D|nr:hypothetical protein [Sphingobium arseniciresistens]
MNATALTAAKSRAVTSSARDRHNFSLADVTLANLLQLPLKDALKVIDRFNDAELSQYGHGSDSIAQGIAWIASEIRSEEDREAA